MTAPLPDAAGRKAELTLPEQFAGFLRLLAANDPGVETSPLPAPGPLAQAAPGSEDFLEQLEAEMVSDGLARAQAERRSAARSAVLTLLAGIDPAGTGTVTLELGPDTGQLLLEWLQRMYVCVRVAELDAAGAPVVIGAAQPAFYFDAEPPSDPVTVGLGVASMTLAHLVSHVQDLLLSSAR